MTTAVGRDAQPSRKDRAQCAVRDDVPVADGVVAAGRGRQHFGLVEVRPQRVDNGKRLIEINDPHADGERRHGSRVPAEYARADVGTPAPAAGVLQLLGCSRSRRTRTANTIPGSRSTTRVT